MAITIAPCNNNYINSIPLLECLPTTKSPGQANTNKYIH
jgi:hypothetical protein